MPIRQYYNVPPLRSDDGTMPAVCAGAAYGVKDSGKPYLRIIVRRNLSVRLASFAVVYRFSAKPLRVKDEENPYNRFIYTGDDINSSEYITWFVDAPSQIPGGCAAMIARIITEDGEEINCGPSNYTDAEFIAVDPDNSDTLSLPLREYLEYRRTLREIPVQPVTPVPETDPVSSLAKKAEAAAVIDEPDLQTMEKAAKKYKKKKLMKRHTARAISGILLLAILAGGVIWLGSLYKPEPKVIDTVTSRLLDAGRYGDAYKTALDKNDTEALQNVCRTASASYLFAKDYENAYLYASAAPEPFEREVIDVFVSLLLTQNRQEEAHRFLKDMPQYSAAMQRVCQSAVDQCLAGEDYAGAYFYAQEAPQSLETYVMEYAAGRIVQGGVINEEIFNVLEELSSSETFDRMAAKAAEKLMEEHSYRESAAIACQIREETARMTEVKTVCETGMKHYMSCGKMEDAAALYEFCAPLMNESSCAKAVQAMIDYSRLSDDKAGVIYFTSLKGGDTSSLTIDGEDGSIRSQLGMTWFLLTADQKRAYHAREMDLYKEAFRIENGRIGDITDAVSVAVSEHMAIVLKKDGTAAALSNNGHNQTPDLSGIKEIVQIAAGGSHVLLLHNDGTVTAVGSDTYGQCRVETWTDVTMVAAGTDFSVGLCSDGTLYACGSDISGQCQVDGITDVMEIAACDQTVVLMKRDGSVKLLGDISMGLKRAENFTDIRRLRAGGCCIIAETNSGTYMMAQGVYNANSGSVITWKNLREFAAGSLCIGRIEQNGSMKTEGDGAPITHPGYEPNGQ